MCYCLIFRALIFQVLTKTFLEAYIKCSNLQHLEALIQLCVSEHDVVSLLKPFKYSASDGEPPKKLIVDFVNEGGATWNKVSARNARALTINSSGIEFGNDNLIIYQLFPILRCLFDRHELLKSATPSH